MYDMLKHAFMTFSALIQNLTYFIFKSITIITIISYFHLLFLLKLRFIGEESVAGGLKINLSDDPTWIIDPVDGTTNFVHK